MFTGIVSTGHIIETTTKDDCQHFAITPTTPLAHYNIGDSIAINGVCLTITHQQENILYVSAVPETLRLTNLSQLKAGSEVNLEAALTPSTSMGGHYVQGHIDVTGRVLEIKQDGASALLVKISLSEPLAKYVVKKGFIAIDGMSITVIDAEADWFSVTFIPHTIENTLVKHYQVGTLVNLEMDLLAKYVEKLLRNKIEVINHAIY